MNQQYAGFSSQDFVAKTQYYYDVEDRKCALYTFGLSFSGKYGISKLHNLTNRKLRCDRFHGLVDITNLGDVKRGYERN
jgi:hypothetical protein